MKFINKNFAITILFLATISFSNCLKLKENNSNKGVIIGDKETSSNNDDPTIPQPQIMYNMNTPQSVALEPEEPVVKNKVNNEESSSSSNSSTESTQTNNSSNANTKINSSDNSNSSTSTEQTSSSSDSLSSNREPRLTTPKIIRTDPVPTNSPPNFDSKKIHNYEDRLNPNKHPENIPEYPEYDVLPEVNHFYQGTVNMTKKVAPLELPELDSNTVQRLKSELSYLKKEVFNNDEKALEKARNNKDKYDSKWLSHQLKINRIIDLENKIKKGELKSEKTEKNEKQSKKDQNSKK